MTLGRILVTRGGPPLAGFHDVPWVARRRAVAMASAGILGVLADAPFGVFGVRLDETIVFWNSGAQRLIGYSPDDVIGRQCHEVMASLSPQGTSAACEQGCPALLALRAGNLPHAFDIRARGATGERRLLSITPMLVAGWASEPPLVLHLVRPAPRGRWIRCRATRRAGRGCAGRRNGVRKGPGDAASRGAHGPRAAGLAPGGGRAPSRLPMNSGSASTPCPTMSATLVGSSEQGPGSTR